MTTNIEAISLYEASSVVDTMKLALEALLPHKSTVLRWYTKEDAAIDALRQAIAAAEQHKQADQSATHGAQPVACIIDNELYFHHEIDWEDLAYQGHGVELLYTAPPPRPVAEPHKPLTDEQPQRWAVYCGICRKQWSVPYQHPGKSVCDECEAAHGIGKGEA